MVRSGTLPARPAFMNARLIWFQAKSVVFTFTPGFCCSKVWMICPSAFERGLSPAGSIKVQSSSVFSAWANPQSSMFKTAAKIIRFMVFLPFVVSVVSQRVSSLDGACRESLHERFLQKCVNDHDGQHCSDSGCRKSAPLHADFSKIGVDADLNDACGFGLH